MSEGRTIWRAKDVAWHDREWIVILVQEFGPAGYAVVDALESQAKAQNDAGRVKTGPHALSRATGADHVTVGHVVSRAVTLGLLDEYEDRDGRFTCRVTWFVADQGRAMAANRKARQRDGTPVSVDDSESLSRSVTLSHAESRPVTECPPTVQDSTEAEVPATQVARKRANRRVDQAVAPDGFSVELHSSLDDCLTVLHHAWDLRGGVEPQPRGVGMAIMRNPRADHRKVARKLEQWLTAGTGQRAACKDIAARFGDWVEEEPAAPLQAVDGSRPESKYAHLDRAAGL